MTAAAAEAEAMKDAEMLLAGANIVKVPFWLLPGVRKDACQAALREAQQEPGARRDRVHVAIRSWASPTTFAQIARRGSVWAQPAALAEMNHADEEKKEAPRVAALRVAAAPSTHLVQVGQASEASAPPWDAILGRTWGLVEKLEGRLDERDRVHDAVSHFSVYCDEASDARADGEETCGAEDHDRGVPNPWGAAWKSKFRAPHVDNLPNSLLDFHTGGEPHVGSV